MRKIISTITALAMAFGSFAVTSPAIAVDPAWDATGAYIVGFQLDGDPTVYSHDMNLTQDGAGNLTGNGGYPAGGPFSYAWSITTGTVSGDSINITADYTLGAVGTTMHMTGTIAGDGTMSGTWDDNYGGGTRTGIWATSSGTATSYSTLVVDPFNSQGWVFNPDPTNATPYNFTIDQQSIGNGSLYVQPIGATAVHKFIALKPMGGELVSNLDSIAYDFMIAGAGDASDANQFYMNVYTNLPSSSTFYDCRFDYVPTTGSTAAFTTAMFNSTDVPTNVADRPADAFTCPATLAGMPVGSTISAFTLNVGDTSLSDVGLAGYLDKVVVDLGVNVTTYDFEAESEGPVTTNVAVSGGMLTATVDDTTTGGSTIASAEYQLNGGTWTAMTAQGGVFDEVSEVVEATLPVLGGGVHEICVRGTDALGNTGESACIEYEITTVVSGGGNIGNPGPKGKKLWTFSTEVNVDPEGSESGMFTLVNHTTNTLCTYNTISGLSIVGDTAMFTASGGTGSCTSSLQVTIDDLGEPGAGVDKIMTSPTGITVSTVISGGNFQVNPLP